MEIKLIEPYGYCFGVDRAISLALETKKSHQNQRVCVLGMLVHNEDAIKWLEKNHIRTIYHKDKQLTDLVDLVPQNAFVILTAHGHSEEVENKLKRKGIQFVDATCPFVNKINAELRKFAEVEGYDVFYIGKKNHAEALASCSISSKIQFIDYEKPVIPVSKNPRIAVATQSTFSDQDIEPILNEVRKIYPKAEYIHGICNASNERQQAILSLDKHYDLIYVVGSKNSNNTATLLRLAKEKYPTSKVIGIANALDISSSDLNDVNSIAIASGASTPKEIVLEVKNKIELLCN